MGVSRALESWKNMLEFDVKLHEETVRNYIRDDPIGIVAKSWWPKAFPSEYLETHPDDGHVPPGGSAAANTSTTAAPSGITQQSHVTSLMNADERGWV